LSCSYGWDSASTAGRQAVNALRLQPGEHVVDIGCGTGLNFPQLRQAVGAQGFITGVDLSEEMLAQARRTVTARGWDNVALVCADAGEYEFPPRLDAVFSTYALTLVPRLERVIARAVQALTPGGRLAVLDMAWPRRLPYWGRYVLFFLRSYGVTLKVLQRRPWEAVQQAVG
jgi:demethylmenaquinone methyltransferase/2-methoxy-6-polyprenyl-1,4-benzoquinol methylase